MRSALASLCRSTALIRDIVADIRANAAAALADPGLRTRHDTIQNAAVVLLSGYVESFLRELAEAYIADVSARHVPFSQLPQAMQLACFVDGGRILGEAARAAFKSRASWVTAAPEDIALRLASPYGGVAQYTLLWEAFAQTNSNPGPDTVKAYLKRCGVERPGEALGVEMSRSPGGHDFTIELKAFMAVRNECAHHGRASNTLYASTLEQYCSLIERLGESMVVVLEQRLTQVPFGPATTPAPVVYVMP